ncbi:MAG: LPS assembly lipoprotein LptE [Burkholderiaceae bacterium]|jgi:LPS-assembly lipoprotein|nr:LPS assembly lipoprotein LptE [Burkholderiaceae bacterium]MDP4969502.1 LPS assembly lipoprotein LptE [Burkholderiaceae bacterium]MDP5111878.1 LPS assembly lipoprotein LptE [Burkholderiaceae bacterium]
MNRSIVRVLLGLMTVLLAGCGFKMQGVTPMPFDSLNITIPQNSQFGADVRRAIRAASPGIVIIEPTAAKPIVPGEKRTIDPKTIAQAKLEQVSEVRTSRIVSLNARGKPEEFELTLVYTFRLVTAKNQIILPNTTLSAARAMPFDERVVQAKEGEAVTLYRDMQKSLVSRMMRRLTAPDIKQRWDEIKASTPADEENVETAIPIQAPADNLPTPWQNPSLTPLPIPVNPGG